MTSEILMTALLSTANINGTYTDPDTGDNYMVKKTNKAINLDSTKVLPIERKANIINKNKIIKDYYE